MHVFVEPCNGYNTVAIDRCLALWDDLFDRTLRPGQSVVLKPNWIASSHKYRETEWESVVTHPAVITSVLAAVLKRLQGAGRVVITDAPLTSCSWSLLMERMKPNLWLQMGKHAGVPVSIMDLRDDEWVVQNDVTVQRKKLSGDPSGSIDCDLRDFSEFQQHRPSAFGYYGADYGTAETNAAHSLGHHRYKVSKTVIEADVFINLPKLKTHKKAGITCSLKNLVGINTYKNWLPHYSMGTSGDGGDQFPVSTIKNRIENSLLLRFKQLLWNQPKMAKWLLPVKSLGRVFFGDTRRVIRSGNWHGNDTIWRMILDLNKVLLYTDPDGNLRPDSPKHRKPYISIVDAITSGDGDGPEAPDPKSTGLLIAGLNPVAVDSTCAKLMGFAWQKIPAIHNAFFIRAYPLCDCSYEDIRVISSIAKFDKQLTDIHTSDAHRFQPHFGWLHHIEAY